MNYTKGFGFSDIKSFEVSDSGQKYTITLSDARVISLNIITHDLSIKINDKIITDIDIKDKERLIINMLLFNIQMAFAYAEFNNTNPSDSTRKISLNTLFRNKVEIVS